MQKKTFDLVIVNDLPKIHGDLKQLESFRFANNRGFPQSYKNFVQEYGYGLTLEEYIINIPIDICSIFARAEFIKSTYIDDVMNNDIWFDIEPDGSLEILKRLYPFAKSINGNYLFWDITDSTDDEFDIYISDFNGIGFRKVAKDLYECFDKLTDSKLFKNYEIFATHPAKRTFEIVELK
ncbi:SMI1/KNR4 family protein [Psychrobacter sp. I-STPA10]|uniref:SMI1/KNR4 family protein n=1 Tax=Psychrobacter sp. I-STPA10 TaxID=2585769 RepID=UPI001E5A709B|nr:SMI1/KNR4 family protein [Psychrobacter sp. I-STPA10]